MAIKIKKKKPLTDEQKRAVARVGIEYTSEMMGSRLLKRRKSRIRRKKHMGMQSNLRREEEN